jgi:uncharacterized membrane protein YcaP (DUF421 family)
MGKDAFFIHCSQARPFSCASRTVAIIRCARLTEEEILEAARRNCGLERMDEIKFAIFEASGQISIIPKRKSIACDDDAAPRDN